MEKQDYKTTSSEEQIQAHRVDAMLTSRSDVNVSPIIIEYATEEKRHIRVIDRDMSQLVSWSMDRLHISRILADLVSRQRDPIEIKV